MRAVSMRCAGIIDRYPPPRKCHDPVPSLPHSLASLSLHRRQEGESRMFRADGEPPLSELLADPVLQLLLKGDGISLDDLRKLIDDLRERRPPDNPPEKG